MDGELLVAHDGIDPSVRQFRGCLRGQSAALQVTNLGGERMLQISSGNQLDEHNEGGVLEDPPSTRTHVKQGLAEILLRGTQALPVLGALGQEGFRRCRLEREKFSAPCGSATS